jgi:hypothetical protein
VSVRAWFTCSVALAGLAAAPLLLVRAESPATAPEPSAVPPVEPPAAAAVEDPVHAAPPPFTEGIFPCTQCHDGSGDPTRRELAFHEDIKLRHAPTHWCVDCHDLANRDVLHLAGGEPVPFTESYRLCAQCHFDKHRDWRLGIHGKRVGQWNGQKTALLCVNCHNPHAPRFGSLKPAPRPTRPEEMRR